jgi:hypothetical protein
MSENRYLSDSYDIVINFILIKNKSIVENLRYIEELDTNEQGQQILGNALLAEIKRLLFLF